MISWFKTIIFTLADRLRDSNDLVKNLENNSLSYSTTNSSKNKFFNFSDLVKLLNYFLIVFQGHGKKVEEGFKIERQTLKYHLLDVFNFPEAKLDEFIIIMESMNCLQILEDEKKNPNILVLINSNFFKNALQFIDQQRRLDEKKRINIPPRSESFMEKIIEQLDGIQADTKGFSEVNLTKIIEGFKERKLPIGKEDFLIIVSQGLAEEVILDQGDEAHSKVNIVKVRELFPLIRFINTIEKINKEKADKA